MLDDLPADVGGSAGWRRVARCYGACPPSSFASPLIGERAATRGRGALEDSDERDGVKRA
jgi:hypothetical protein